MIRIFFLIAEFQFYNLNIYIKVNEYEQVKNVNGFVCFFSKIKEQISKKLMRLFPPYLFRHTFRRVEFGESVFGSIHNHIFLRSWVGLTSDAKNRQQDIVYFLNNKYLSSYILTAVYVKLNKNVQCQTSWNVR